jgi:hypothetical protein
MHLVFQTAHQNSETDTLTCVIAAQIMVDIGPRIEIGGTDKIQTFMSQYHEGISPLEEVAHAISTY